MSKGLKRNTIDKFYTKESIAKKCFDVFIEAVDPNESDLVIEPSAGNGSFVNLIKLKFSNHLFYDILPENIDIIQCDFLEISPPTSGRVVHTLGNPPFGRQSSLAIKFIKKCCTFSQSVSFILPKSFRKDSMQRHFDSYFHLIREIDLPKNSFILDGNEQDVPCVFQVWKRSNKKRQNNDPEIPRHFEFVKKTSSPDISLRRVGVNAGKICNTNIEQCSEQSHYFIKFQDKSAIDKIINNNIMNMFRYDNTVGPRSISKPELIKILNQFT